MVQSIELAWIVVNDINKALKFYTEIVGLKLLEHNKEFGWAELSGHLSGARLGIAQKSEMEVIQPGQNAVVTLTVDDLEATRADLEGKGVKMIGETQEIPGMVKLQMISDEDGNQTQLIQMLKK
jgi:predicted enzyme related to lactoylglutathione lyase